MLIPTTGTSSCPRSPSQTGVCGCPSFWSPSTPSPPPSPMHEPSTPRETCFFWYHNTCRRGAQCPLAHEAHATWPISAPPRFTHYEKCVLAKCPLRWDMITPKNRDRERETDREKVSALIDPSSQAMNGEYGGSETETDDEVDTYAGREKHSDSDSGSKMERGARPTPGAETHRMPLGRRKRVISASPSTNTPVSNSDSDSPNVLFARALLSAAPTGPRTCSAPSSALRGPRKRNRSVPSRPGAAGKICFEWYHSRLCARRLQNKCPHAHYMSKHGGEVSVPLGMRGHVGCVLELCPLRWMGAEKAGKVQEVERVSVVGCGGRSWLEKCTTGGETEQEVREIRRRMKADCRDRREGKRLDKKRDEGRLNCGDGVDGKQKVDETVRKKVRQPWVLVEYKLPLGEERLEWDTDLVRRTFGEIE